MAGPPRIEMMAPGRTGAIPGRAASDGMRRPSRCQRPARGARGQWPRPGRGGPPTRPEGGPLSGRTEFFRTFRSQLPAVVAEALADRASETGPAGVAPPGDLLVLDLPEYRLDRVQL